MELGDGGEGAAPATAASEDGVGGLSVLIDQSISAIQSEYGKLEVAKATPDGERKSALEEVAAAKHSLEAEKAAMVDTFVFKSERVTLQFSSFITWCHLNS